MNVKLKVLHGKLQSRDGDSAGLEVPISKSRFVIGTATDCNMRCPSSSISEHHCEIVVDGDHILLRDLGSESGTYLNGFQVERERLLQAGDHLRVGRLEFELSIEQPVAAESREPDPVDEFVSDLLSEADEAERATRLADPQLRQFKATSPEVPEESEPEEQDRISALRKRIPVKKPPGKLPPAPSVTADDTVSAAEETLKKFLEKPKRPAN